MLADLGTAGKRGFTPGSGRDKMPEPAGPRTGLKGVGMAATTLSETAPILELLLKHPRQAWLNQDNVRGHWRELNYTAEPSFERACAEYEALADLLGRYAGEVRFLPEDGRTGPPVRLPTP